MNRSLNSCFIYPALVPKSCPDRLESSSTMKWMISALRTWPTDLESLLHRTISFNQVWLDWIITLVFLKPPSLGCDFWIHVCMLMDSSVFTKRRPLVSTITQRILLDPSLQWGRCGGDVVTSLSLVPAFVIVRNSDVFSFLHFKAISSFPASPRGSLLFFGLFTVVLNMCQMNVAVFSH